MVYSNVILIRNCDVDVFIIFAQRAVGEQGSSLQLSKWLFEQYLNVYVTFGRFYV